ncbi:branched-chain amino acid ABC transporter substrate-binding protein [Aneurinibacillus tyrosinisolvens]|uniref:branched-chain amino acid ABC transporter substrate-binding protein n=1 Tax=Aneurinibacillus tyrosinisolvens TaxID=1443435 RepID=UPI000A91C964|nr:branched-chain amino acid ABC transporter substrate-binding protein [Aneurinibacillus tyrosinisolvens]
MKISKMLAAAAATLLLGISITGCGNTNQAEQTSAGKSQTSGSTIKIGVPAPLSGTNAKMGEDIVQAAKIAATQINDKGGVLGKKIEIVSIDDACDAQVATQAANKLVTSNVAAVVGHYCSSATLPATTVYNDQGIPFIAAASSNPKITEQGFENVFRMVGRDDQQSKFVSEYLINKQKKKKIAILHDNTTYAKGLADETKSSVEKLGGEVVFFDAITPGEKDFSVTLSKLKPLQPDAIYWTGYYAEGGLLIKQAKDLGINTLFMVGDSNNDPTLIKIAGPAAEGVIVDSVPTPEFLPGAKDFVSKYKETYSKDPGPYTTFTYDGVNAVAEAIKQANSTDSKAVVAALHNLNGYSGVTGNVKFDEKGDRTDLLYITTKVKDGKFVSAEN